ncbi:MAG TPA: hypothetical protein VGJ84_12450 [Polyangiaceae bacterium]
MQPAFIPGYTQVVPGALQESGVYGYWGNRGTWAGHPALPDPPLVFVPP